MPTLHDSPEGETHSCTHTKDGTICDNCLGENAIRDMKCNRCNNPATVLRPTTDKTKRQLCNKCNDNLWKEEDFPRPKEDFVDAIKDKPEEIILWARAEIKKYNALIKLVKSKDAKRNI